MLRRQLVMVLASVSMCAAMEAQSVDADTERAKLYSSEAAVFREECRAVGDEGLHWFRYHSFGDVYRVELPCEMWQDTAKARAAQYAWLMSRRGKPFKVDVERKPKK